MQTLPFDTIITRYETETELGSSSDEQACERFLVFLKIILEK